MTSKFNDIRSYVIFEKAMGRPSKYLKLPVLSIAEKEEIINECNSSINKLKSLRLGDLSVYQSSIKDYQMILDIVNK